MTSVAAGTWIVDLAHTQAAFTARHFFGQTVHGTITVTAGTIEVGKDGRPQRFHATLDPSSIDTGHARRDADLCGKRFLAVDAYPLMEVTADRIAATADGWCADAVLRGHGCEARLPIDATLEGAATAPRLQLSGSARLDLRDVGIRGAGLPGPPVRRRVSFDPGHAAIVKLPGASRGFGCRGRARFPPAAEAS
ncbi:MAG: YceI family protein [Streptosporangiaceae bacterium]